MTLPRQMLGKQGEAIAIQALTERHYIVVARNWHCKFGELDIVCWQNAVMVFIEVKTRAGNTPSNPFENITPAKRRRLIASANLYLAEHHLDHIQWRIDAIGIAIPRSGQPVIEHVEDALDW